MIIKPKTRGFICVTAHPIGCATNVTNAIKHVQATGKLPNPPRNVLVLGASSGYGLSSRISAAFSGGAATLGVSFEKEPTEKKTASAGWYNSLAFDAAAKAQGLWAKTLNLDAFANASKEAVINLAKAELGAIDLVIYSLASPVRLDPDTGELWRSVIKPIGAPCRVKNLNVDKAEIIDDMVLEPASDEEIAATVKVMGGEDWELWLAALADAGVLSTDCRTIAYTYIGSEMTWPIYRQGTIGKAKEDLDRAADAIRALLPEGDARVAVLKAVVTQASAAIPVVPLYNSILFRVMKDLQLHEGCPEHIDRLFRTQLYRDNAMQPDCDEGGRIRLDAVELSEEVQAKVRAIWAEVTTENLNETTDFSGFREDFLRIFGFAVEGIDYDADLSPLWQPA